MSNTVDPRTVTVGEHTAAPSGPRTEEQIQADLERQRAELAATIDQLYARVQPAALAQEAKEEATVRFESLKESAFADPAGRDRRQRGGHQEGRHRRLSTVGAIGVLVLLATRKPRRARRHARRIGREATKQMLAALAKADEALEA